LKVIRKIYKKYQTELKSDFENFKSNFIPCLTQIIYRTALNTTSAIFNGDFNTDEYNKESLQVVISHEIGALLGEIDDLREFEQIVYDVLTSSDDDIIDFLKMLFKSYWMLCLLNIDPEVIEVQKKAFSNYIFYLDSHIVIRAMVEAGGSSNLCSEIIRLCNDSKLKMRLSYTIYIEVKKAFESAYSIFRETAGDTDRAIKIFHDLSRKSDIIEGYIFAKQKNRNLSWQTYMNRFFSPIKKDKLKNYLNRELNIEVMDQREFTEGEWGRIEEIKDLLLSRRNVTIDDKNSDQSKKIDKQVILRTNEATQMAIIYNYRNIDDDHQYWFVTFDKFVYEASIELSKQSDDMYGFPCFIKPARMLEMLSQLKHDKVEVNTFRSILNSESIHIVANSIETEIIAELLRNRVDYNVESKETLREMYDDILSRPILQDAYQKYANSEENIDEADANKIIKDTIIETLQENLKKQNIKIHGLNDEIVDKTIQLRKEKKRSKYLRSQLTRATKRK
jgi:hypothetical protein